MCFSDLFLLYTCKLVSPVVPPKPRTPMNTCLSQWAHVLASSWGAPVVRGNGWVYISSCRFHSFLPQYLEWLVGWRGWSNNPIKTWDFSSWYLPFFLCRFMSDSQWHHWFMSKSPDTQQVAGTEMSKQHNSVTYLHINILITHGHMYSICQCSHGPQTVLDHLVALQRGIHGLVGPDGWGDHHQYPTIGANPQILGGKKPWNNRFLLGGRHLSTWGFTVCKASPKMGLKRSGFCARQTY